MPQNCCSNPHFYMLKFHFLSLKYHFSTMRFHFLITICHRVRLKLHFLRKDLNSQLECFISQYVTAIFSDWRIITWVRIMISSGFTGIITCTGYPRSILNVVGMSDFKLYSIFQNQYFFVELIFLQIAFINLIFPFFNLSTADHLHKYINLINLILWRSNMTTYTPTVFLQLTSENASLFIALSGHTEK